MKRRKLDSGLVTSLLDRNVNTICVKFCIKSVQMIDFAWRFFFSLQRETWERLHRTTSPYITGSNCACLWLEFRSALESDVMRDLSNANSIETCRFWRQSFGSIVADRGRDQGVKKKFLSYSTPPVYWLLTNFNKAPVKGVCVSVCLHMGLFDV